MGPGKPDAKPRRLRLDPFLTAGEVGMKNGGVLKPSTPPFFVWFVQCLFLFADFITDQGTGCRTAYSAQGAAQYGIAHQAASNSANAAKSGSR